MNPDQTASFGALCSGSPCSDPGIFVRGGPGPTDIIAPEGVQLFISLISRKTITFKGSRGKGWWGSNIFHGVLTFSRGGGGGGGGGVGWWRGPIAYSYENL